MQQSFSNTLLILKVPCLCVYFCVLLEKVWSGKSENKYKFEGKHVHVQMYMRMLLYWAPQVSLCKLRYRVCLLTWPAAVILLVYWSKRTFLHKTGVQFPGDWFTHEDSNMAMCAILLFCTSNMATMASTVYLVTPCRHFFIYCKCRASSWIKTSYTVKCISPRSGKVWALNYTACPVCKAELPKKIPNHCSNWFINCTSHELW